VLLGFILTYGSCSNDTRFGVVVSEGIQAVTEVSMGTVSGNTVTNQSMGAL
jgi:hypothetical protein